MPKFRWPGRPRGADRNSCWPGARACGPVPRLHERCGRGLVQLARLGHAMLRLWRRQHGGRHRHPWHVHTGNGPGRGPRPGGGGGGGGCGMGRCQIGIRGKLGKW